MPRPTKPRLHADRESPWLARITHFAFALALVLVCARAAMLETLRNPIEPLPGADAGAKDPGPAASLLLDLLFCLPALLVLLRRTLDPTYVLRWSGSHALLFALAAWALLSPLWSADRFAALVHAAGLAASLVLLWSMIQLVRSWTRLRIVAGVAFGLLLVYVAAGLQYRLSELPQLRADWLENRGQYLRQQGLEPGSFQARQFEQKVLGGDLGRFSTSPNTYAAAVVLLLTASAGVAVQRRKHRDPLAWIAPFLLVLPAAAFVIYHTHSRVAMLTPIAAFVLFALIALFGARLAPRWKTAYWTAVALFALGLLAVVGHGAYHGSLPDKSMTFRWYYWTGAAHIVREHPLLGVGYANFGYHYPAVRNALATEQVKDPHNLFVRFLAELGLVGGLLITLWIFRTAWELARPVLPPDTPVPPTDAKRRTLLHLALLALSAALLNSMISIDWQQNSAYVTIQLFEKSVGTLLLFAGLLAVALRSVRDESIDGRPSPWLLYGLLTALLVFLLHNLIDFSFFEPGPMAIVALLAGAALGLRHPSAAGQTRKPLVPAAALTLASIAWLAAAGLLLAPIAQAESHVAAGDEALRLNRLPDAARHYLAAREAFPANADYAYRSARALAMDEAPPEQVYDLLAAAVRANPRDARHYVFRANYRRHQPNPDVEAVRADYSQALALDPRDVSLRLEFADVLAELKDNAGAAQQYREALAHDDRLPPDEPKRLSQERRTRIETRIRELSPRVG